MVADRREEGAVLTHRTANERKRRLKNSLCTKKKMCLSLSSFIVICINTAAD